MKQEKKEKLFEEFDSFRTLFGHTLYVEHIFLEYDCIPILCACVDEAGNKWFCNCTEFRYCERWTIYPTTEERIQAAIRKELTYKEAFGKSATTAYVYNIDYITGKESLSEVLINELSVTDALPDGW